jgi:Fe2+ transport system protein B
MRRREEEEYEERNAARRARYDDEPEEAGAPARNRQATPGEGYLDIFQQLDRIEDLIVSSRRVPFSSSVMVNEAEIFELLDELRSSLPDELKQARWMVKEKEELMAEARREAERIREEAREERARLIEETEIVKAARAEAERIVEEARAQAREIRLEAEDYADERLANLEVTCYKLLEVIKRARERLQGTRERSEGGLEFEE